MIKQIKNLPKNEKVAVFVAVSLVVIYLVAPLFDLTDRFINLPNTEIVTSEDQKELVVQDLLLGIGRTAQIGDILVVEYTGTLLDGTSFDSNIGRAPFTFTLGAGEVIEGWELGVVGMMEGGLRLLVVPSNMGYGEFQAGIIPPNSTLVFEVKLLQVIKSSVLPEQ